MLAYARRAAGLTQDALARLAGTSQPTLSAYERGAKSPSLAVAERIIEATGHRLEVVPNLEFVEVPGQHGLHPFWRSPTSCGGWIRSARSAPSCSPDLSTTGRCRGGSTTCASAPIGRALTS